MNKTPELFDCRNSKKKEVEFILSKKKLQARIGEFWWYREGVNIGNEISKDGRFMRVCLVLQNDLGNGLLLVAPITTKYHKWMEKYYIKVNNYQKYGLKECWIVLNQIKSIDSKRLGNLTCLHKPQYQFAVKVRYLYRDLINSSIKKSP